MEIQSRLKALAEPGHADSIKRYFRGGEPDVFLGVRMADLRKLAREVPLEACAELLQSDVHEERMVALLALGRFAKGGQRQVALDLYLQTSIA